MTNEQLWGKLEKASKIKDLLKRSVEMSLLLKHGYEQDLDVLASGFLRGENSELFHQGYIDYDGGRFMTCYTSWEHAKKEWRRGETDDLVMVSLEYSIRNMINNAFNKQSILGLVFNPEDENSIVVLPKEILEMFMPGEKPLPEGFSES